MPEIRNRDEAAMLVELIDEGAFTPEEEAGALADLEAFRATESQQRRADTGNAQGAARVGALRSAAAGVARVPIGAGQAVSAAADIVVPGTLQDYNQAATELLDQIRGRPAKPGVFGEPTELGAELAAGAGLSPTARVATLAKTIKSIAGTSLFTSVTGFDPEAGNVADKAQSAALGSLFGVTLTGGLATGKFVHGNTRSFITKLFNRDRNRDLQRSAIELGEQFPGLRELFTVSQSTGSIHGAKMEAGLAANYALKNYQDISRTLQRGLAQYGDRYGSGWNPGEFAAQAGPRGTEAIRKAASDLATIKNLEWTATMDAADAALTSERIAARGIKGKAQTVLPLGDFEGKLLALTEKYGISKDDLGAALQTMRRETATFNGNVSLETFTETMRKANAENWVLARGLTDNQQRAFGRDVREMLFGIVDEADPAVSDSIVWLKRAREGYRQRAQQIDELRSSRVATVLGLDAPNPAPEQAFASMLNADRSSQKLMRETLEKYDPALLQEARALWWRQAMEGATITARDGVSPQFDPLRFAETMLNTVGKADDQTAGLFSAADAAQIRAVMKDMRVLGFKMGGFGQSPDLESAVRVGSNPLQPASAPFRGALWWRFFGSRNFERKLFTKEGRAQLRTLAKVSDTPEFNAMLSRFMSDESSVITDSFPDDQQRP